MVQDPVIASPRTGCTGAGIAASQAETCPLPHGVGALANCLRRAGWRRWPWNLAIAGAPGDFGGGASPRAPVFWGGPAASSSRYACPFWASAG